jgi:hypothetical protein
MTNKASGRGRFARVARTSCLADCKSSATGIMWRMRSDEGRVDKLPVVRCGEAVDHPGRAGCRSGLALLIVAVSCSARMVLSGTGAALRADPLMRGLFGGTGARLRRVKGCYTADLLSSHCSGSGGLRACLEARCEARPNATYRASRPRRCNRMSGRLLPDMTQREPPIG